MNEQGLWELFCKTGLPAAWLAAGQRQENEARWKEPVQTAFQPKIKQV